MARADKITIENKKIEYYSDFLNDFTKNPVTGYLSKVTNEESVKTSIRNLVLTGKGERFYQPSVGSTIRDSLFNPLDATTLLGIKQSVIDTINNFEPRAELYDVIVTPYEGDNSVFIKIIFGLKNFQNQAFVLDLLVKRVR